METMGERIKIAREAAGMTQEQLGKLLGVTGVSVMRYEKNTRQPRTEQLSQIADALGVTVGYLLGYGNIEDAQLINSVQKHDIDKMGKMLGIEKEMLVSVLSRRELQKSFSHVIEKINKLNPTGQQFVITQISALIDELLKIPEFTKKAGEQNAVDPKENE